MHVSEASLWFANESLDGWNGSAWVTEVAMGDFHTYDRFITERTFGAKKRIFLAPQSLSFDPATYPVVRTSDGTVWIVVSDNADIKDDITYEQGYLLVHAAYTADIIELTTTTLASGQQGDPVPTVVGTSVCDLERYTANSSDAFDTVTYGIYKIIVPSSVAVDTDNEISIDGITYEVQEVYEELLTKVAKAIKRAA